MHELSLVEEIIRISTAAAQGRPVRRITLKIGALSCVMPEALQFCFDSGKEGTVLAAAQLQIERIPGEAECHACGQRYALEELYQPCPCGSCERSVLQGQEILIQTLEYD